MSESLKYDTIMSMKLKHLPNDAKLLIQRQTGGKINKESIQFGLPSTFVNPDNCQIVTMNGPSIQLEQIPELIEILTKAYEKYSGCKLPETKSGKTNTFADVYPEE